MKKKWEMKRFLSGLIVVCLISATNISAYAAENQSSSQDFDPTIGEVISHSEASELAVPLTRGKAETPLYHWSSTLGLFGGSSKSFATNEESTDPYYIDYIFVSCAIYENDVNVDGAMEEAEHYAAVTASISGRSGLSGVVVKREVYGTHRFEHKGFESMDKESHAS